MSGEQEKNNGDGKSISERRVVAAIVSFAALISVVFCFVTPPFQAPDEVGHYWRACALSRGDVLPSMEGGKPNGLIARGERDLVASLWVATAGASGEGAKIGMQRLRNAAEVALHPEELVRLSFPAQFTALPYIPQALVCWFGRLVNLRPLFTFYLGRLVNAACALGLVFFAISRSRSQWPFLGVAVLPMLLFICSSFSPDALTIGLAFVVTSVAISPPRSTRGWLAFCATALALALCKPVYFLLPLIALVRSDDRRMWRVALLAIAVITGVAISAATVRRNFYPMRSGVVVDPSSQVNVIKQAPLRYARIVTSDYIGHGHEYLRQFVGTLGWLDVPLPHWLTDVAVVLLLLLGVTQRLDLRMRDRLALAVVALLSLAMVSTSQYLAWSMVGGDQISGIQGRYFLPLAPALLLLFVTPKLASWSRFVRPLYFTTLTVANVTAIVFLLQRYY